LEPEDIKGKSDEEIYEKIESIPQLLLWLTKALDELIGKFPITMEIAENDLLDMNDEYAEWKSNPPPDISDLPFYLQNDKTVSYREANGVIVKTVKIPNLAEAVAEILGAGIVDRQTSNLSIELLSRIITEIGSTKNVATSANAWSEAVADYLGFATKDLIKEIDFCYNPIAEVKQNQPISWKKLLEPTKVKTPLPEFNDNLTFEAKFELIKEIHAIVKAALTEGIGKSDAQMLRQLKNFAAEMGVIPKSSDNNNDGIPDQEQELDDFDRFLEDAEWGFITKGAGASDVTPQPYGRELSKRPKIRRLGNLAPNTDP
jgi:hypothetical protein